MMNRSRVLLLSVVLAAAGCRVGLVAAPDDDVADDDATDDDAAGDDTAGDDATDDDTADDDTADDDTTGDDTAGDDDSVSDGTMDGVVAWQYVAPGGDDSAAGGPDTPKRTLAAGLDALQDAMFEWGVEEMHLFLAAGEYSEVPFINFWPYSLSETRSRSLEVHGGLVPPEWTADPTGALSIVAGLSIVGVVGGAVVIDHLHVRADACLSTWEAPAIGLGPVTVRQSRFDGNVDTDCGDYYWGDSNESNPIIEDCTIHGSINCGHFSRVEVARSIIVVPAGQKGLQSSGSCGTTANAHMSIQQSVFVLEGGSVGAGNFAFRGGGIRPDDCCRLAVEGNLYYAPSDSLGAVGYQYSTMATLTMEDGGYSTGSVFVAPTVGSGLIGIDMVRVGGVEPWDPVLRGPLAFFGPGFECLVRDLEGRCIQIAEELEMVDGEVIVGEDAGLVDPESLDFRLLPDSPLHGFGGPWGPAE
jgi:hypothetical protein